MSKGWLQLVLVGAPVLMLVGSWLALKRLPARRDGVSRQQGNKSDGKSD